MGDSAHKILVQRYLQMDVVEQHLKEYPNIAAHYDVDDFRRCADKSPYYSHYLAWRLGIWGSRSPELTFFDGLLATANSLKGWNDRDEKKKLRTDCPFEKFWQLLWELQVAKFFASIQDLEVEWVKSVGNSSPDLKIKFDNEIFYVECYTYTKSFGILGFIQELFAQIDSRVSCVHGDFNPLSLTKKDTEAFLDELFRPYLGQSDLKENDVLYDKDNLLIYVKGSDPFQIPPSWLVMHMSQGNYETYLNVALHEAFAAKMDEKTQKLKNGLDNCHPHVLAINFLLSPDYQIARGMQTLSGRNLILPDTWQKYDAIFLAPCGIREIPSVARSILKFRVVDHPLSKLLNTLGDSLS